MKRWKVRSFKTTPFSTIMFSMMFVQQYVPNIPPAATQPTSAYFPWIIDAVWKFEPQFFWRPGHQVTISGLNSKDIFARFSSCPSQSYEEWPETHIFVMRPALSATGMFHILDACDLRQCYFCDLPIISKWENLEMFLIFIKLIGSVWFSKDHNTESILDDLGSIFCHWSIKTPSEVNVFVNNFRSNWDRGTKWLSKMSH